MGSFQLPASHRGVARFWGWLGAAARSCRSGFTSEVWQMNKSLLVIMVLVTVVAWSLPTRRVHPLVERLPADAACAECGMAVADARFAARSTVEEGARLRLVYFDDPGCLFDHVRWHPELVVRSHAFAVDSKPRWVVSEEVLFVVDPKIPTPMGTGLLAVDRAEAARRRMSGERIESVSRAATFRKEWMEAKFGKPKP